MQALNRQENDLRHNFPCVVSLLPGSPNSHDLTVRQLSLSFVCLSSPSLCLPHLVPDRLLQTRDMADTFSCCFSLKKNYISPYYTCKKNLSTTFPYFLLNCCSSSFLLNSYHTARGNIIPCHKCALHSIYFSHIYFIGF